MNLENLGRHGDKTAFYTEDWGAKSYLDLVGDINQMTSRLGTGRKLVFLYGTNNYSSIVGYFACLIGNHPVLLLNGTGDPYEDLKDKFQPNIILDCTGGNTVLSVMSEQQVNMHPDLRLLLTTSGSTGSPRLVKLTLPNLMSNAASIIDYLGLTDADVGITSLKFNYSYGLSVVNTHVAAGASLVLTDKSITEPAFWSVVKNHKVSNWAGVPHQFEILEQIGHRFYDYPSIRLITQAGGKLAPDTARHFISQAQKNRARFFLMYGQTEASPRISYVPPDLAMENADCIGIPVNGGHIVLVDDAGVEIDKADQVGELVYTGPNVMMGYAANQNDLTLPQQSERLETGDLAMRQSNGLFKIEGRKERFVKLFGLRVNLDDAASKYGKSVAPCATIGTDEKLIFVFEQVDDDKCGPLRKQIADEIGISPNAIQIKVIAKIPRLPTGKIDYASLSERYLKPATQAATWRQFLKHFVLEWVALFGFRRHDGTSVKRIFQLNLGADIVSIDQSFADLSGNSLSYVSTSVDLEIYLGYLPENWHTLSIRQLEALAAEPQHGQQQL